MVLPSFLLDEVMFQRQNRSDRFAAADSPAVRWSRMETPPHNRGGIPLDLPAELAHKGGDLDQEGIRRTAAILVGIF